MEDRHTINPHKDIERGRQSHRHRQRKQMDKRAILKEDFEDSSNNIWYRNPQKFLADTNVARFFPSRDDDLVEQLNATMRFSVYLSVILLIVKRNPNVLFIAVIVGALTYAVNESRKRDDERRLEALEHLDLGQGPDGKICAKPTHDNPFMNLGVNDIADFPNKPPACDITHKNVQKEAEKHFDHDLYRDVSDVFGRNSSSRQFYTMPSTTVPNDQNGFAEWLYKRGPTCKEGNGMQCSRHQARR